MIKNIFISSSLIVLFLFILFIHFYYLNGIPHVPDDVGYVFMGKMLSHGMINTKIPVSPQHFNYFPEILDVTHGTWLFQYPFGHPLIIAIGMLLHIPHLILPLVAVLTLFVLYQILRLLFPDTPPWFLFLLPFLSPFFLENSASFMSHTSAAFYVTIAFYFIVLHQKKEVRWATFLSGIFIGLLFNTRPLTAAPFFLICFIVLCLSKKAKLKGLIWYLLGFSLFFLLWCLYNLKTTGSLLTSEYLLVNQNLFGLQEHVSDAQFLTQRWRNMTILFRNLGPMLFNLPVLLTYPLIFLPLFFRKVYSWIIIWYICVLSLPVVYFFYNGTFLMYGPRFWYEILPFIFLLTAYGLGLLYKKFQKVTIVLIVIMTIVSFGRFFSLIPVTSPDFFSPLKASELNEFNFTDTRILQLVSKHNLRHAVVFVTDCQGNWWCYGSVFSQNNPSLTSDVIYAKDLGSENNALFTYFKDRKFYRVDYYHPILTQIMPK